MPLTNDDIQAIKAIVETSNKAQTLELKQHIDDSIKANNQVFKAIIRDGLNLHQRLMKVEAVLIAENKLEN